MYTPLLFDERLLDYLARVQADPRDLSPDEWRDVATVLTAAANDARLLADHLETDDDRSDLAPVVALRAVPTPQPRRGWKPSIQRLRFPPR
jgi:hypothetical protein